MAIVLYDLGAFVLLAEYIYDKNGIWWFRRRIPDDVARHYPGKKRELRFSLSTRDKVKAAQEAHRHALSQDALWKSYRSGEVKHGAEEYKAALALLASYGLKPGQWEEYDAAGLEPDRFICELEYQAGIDERETPHENADHWKHDLPPVHKLAADLFYGESKPAILLSDALVEFQSLKVTDTDSKSEKDRVKVVERIIQRYGDLPIDQYTRDHANDFVKYLLEEHENATTSVRRRINWISAIFTLMHLERKLPHENVFKGLVIKGYGEDSKK